MQRKFFWHIFLIMSIYVTTPAVSTMNVFLLYIFYIWIGSLLKIRKFENIHKS